MLISQNMKKILLIASIFSASILSSCTITKPVSATSNTVGSKKGESEGTCYFGVMCFNVDASIQKAAKNGGITKISTVDLKTSNMLGIVVTYTCIVTGE
ncbi:MAG: hypothetical protein RJA76_1063 [Bacteroidota bacterium]